MKRKILLTLLLASILACLLVVVAGAVEVDGVYYDLNEAAGTATINRDNRGSCTLEIVNVPEIITYNGNKYTVTGILDRSFGHQDGGAGNKYIKKVTLPKTITDLSGASQLFRNCASLEEVTLSGPSTRLNEGMFWGNGNLKKLDLSGLTELETLDNIAMGVSSLQEVKLPPKTKTIISKAFQSTGLTSLTLPNTVESIGTNAFQSTKITKLVLPASLLTVSGAAFHSTGLIQTIVIASDDLSGYNTSNVFDGTGATLIFYAGDDVDSVKALYSKKFGSYTAVSYETYLLNPDATYTNTIVYGTQNCPDCGEVKSGKSSFIFTDYESKMYDAEVCASCKKTSISKTYDAILEFYGYAVEINGDRVCSGFAINKKSLDIYNTKTNKELTFGVTATTVSKEVEQFNPVTNDLNPVNDRTMVARVDATMESVDFILLGFGPAYYEVPLIMCVFVYDGETISYVGNGGCNAYATPFTFASKVK